MPVTVDGEDEEERQHGLDQDAGGRTRARAEEGCPEVGHLPLPAGEGAEQDGRGGEASEELRDPVDDRELRADLPPDEGAQGDGGVEVAARDVARRGDHHADREPMGEGHEQEVRVVVGAPREVEAGRNDRARAGEDQREGAHEFRDCLAHVPDAMLLSSRAARSGGRYFHLFYSQK